MRPTMAVPLTVGKHRPHRRRRGPYSSPRRTASARSAASRPPLLLALLLLLASSAALLASSFRTVAPPSRCGPPRLLPSPRLSGGRGRTVPPPFPCSSDRALATLAAAAGEASDAPSAPPGPGPGDGGPGDGPAFAVTRRAALASAASAAAAAAAAASSSAAALLSSPRPSWAAVDDDDGSGPPERAALLRAIAAGSPDTAAISSLIAKLEPLDPSRSTGASSPYLDGRWELIYGSDAGSFSPLLNLPPPIRPRSLQLLGEEAAVEVGAGRVAQVLNFPLLPLSIVLSSGAVPVKEDNGKSNDLEIYPPFRLEVVWGSGRLRGSGGVGGGGGAGSRVRLVESGSDADFRALNARDEQAQLAGRNLYRQRYLETTGKAGDLRISEVVAGDPVIVGQLFVHRRL